MTAALLGNPAICAFASGLADATDAAALAARGPSATPLSFGGRIGYLHPAQGDVGVVFCGAWGYEALCAQRACAEFAEMLASVGYPTLRFDYPGVGNSEGDLAGRTLDDWIGSVAEAAQELRRTSGAKDIVLAGFGLGCLIACAAAERGLAVRGLVLLAPPLTGRRYLRETQALAAMVSAPDDGSDQMPEGAVSVAGFALPASFAAALRGLDPARYSPSAGAFCLVAARSDTDISSLTEGWTAAGVQVRTHIFDGYAEVMAGPTTSRTPRATFLRLLAEVADLCPYRAAAEANDTPAEAARVATADYVEEAARFGEGERLFGVYCRPAQTAEGAPVVVIVNAGRNPHTGWRRMGVEMARQLAARGVASLRFDNSGVGESGARPGQPAETLYSDWPVLDALEAVDFVKARGTGPVTLLGVCSGAFVGLQAAVSDGRVSGLVAANLYRFVWDPSENVAHALRFANRAIGPALTRMFTRERMSKILSGQFDVRPAVRHALKRGWRKFGVMSMSWFGAFGPRGALYAECMRRFGILRARGVETALCYSAGDEGLKEIDDYFGKGGCDLAKYPNVRVAVIDKCDHNFTPPRANEWLLEQVVRVVDATVARHAAR